MNPILPYEEYLPAALDQTRQEDLLAHSLLLKKFIALGAQLLDWETENIKGDPVGTSDEINEQVVVTAMFGRLLAHLDACATLVAVGSITSCSTLARPIFELSLELDYLLANTGEIAQKRKVDSFLIIGYENELAGLYECLEKEKYSTIHEEIRTRTKIVEDKLGHLRYKYLATQYKDAVFKKDNQTARKPITPKWYALATWDGDKKLKTAKDLLEHMNSLGRVEDYTQFSLLSNFTHSSMLIQEHISFDDNGQIILNFIRNAEGYKDFVSGIINAVGPTYLRMSERRTPDQQGNYKANVLEFMQEYNSLFPKQTTDGSPDL